MIEEVRRAGAGMDRWPRVWSAGPVHLHVLGPLEMRVHDRPLGFGGFSARALVALLAANVGRVTSVNALVDGLWGLDPPPNGNRTVRTYVSRLRRALSPAAAALGVDQLVVTHPVGYVLRLPPELLDVVRFECLVAEGRDALAASQPAAAAELLSSALAMWGGDAYGEFADIPLLRLEATRLRELRLTAMADRVDAELAAGAGATLVDELTGLTERYPGHDRLWAQLMIALYRAGRQADASETFVRARIALIERFGLHPSPRLVDTHRQVLANDIRLLSTAAGRPGMTGTRVGPAGSHALSPSVGLW